MKLDLLAIAPHPDDVELTCGGTMLKMAQAGYRTGILDLTRGETGTRGSPETRLKEAARAGKILNAAVRRNLGLPDAHLQVCDEQKEAIAAVIRELEPHTVILPYWEGRHPDHYTAATLGWEACFVAGLKNYALAGRSLPSIQDYLRRCVCGRSSHFCSRYHRAIRSPPPSDSRLCIAISSAKARRPLESFTPLGQTRRAHERHRSPLRQHDRRKVRGRLRGEGSNARRRVVKLPVRSM